MTDPPPQLDYAPRPPLHRRRVFRRIAIAAAILLFLAIAFHFAEPASIRLRLLTAQRKTMSLSYPATQVAWDEDRARINAWTPGPPWTTHTDQSGKILAIHFSPTPFRTLFQIPGTPGPGLGAVYAQSRNAGKGPRLVAVCIEGIPYRFIRQPGTSPTAPLPIGALTIIVQHPATLLSAPTFSRTNWTHPTLESVPPGQLRIFWGQPHPTDPSRFSITYDTPTTRNAIDGRLLPDDSVQLQLLPAPATAPLAR